MAVSRPISETGGYAELVTNTPLVYGIKQRLGFDTVERREMVRNALLIAGVLVAGGSAAVGGDARAATLIWPESRQPIPNGGDVQLWEDFHLDAGPMAIPCQATPPSTVVVNGQSVDEVRELGAPTWSECGSVAVTGGWVAIGFDERAMKAVAVPAVALTEPDGCTYELDEIEGHENELAGYASWTVSGSATLTGSPPPSAEAPCAPELPLNGTVELFGPQAGGFGVIPWGAPPSPGGEGRPEEGAAEDLSQRMVTATRLAKLGRLFSSAANASFNATGAGTLAVAWYAAARGASSARARSASRVLVARGATVFSSRGTKRVIVTRTRRGQLLLRHAPHLTLTVRASFTPHGSAAVVVTGNSSAHR